MTHRILSNDGQPARVLEHVRGAGAIIRIETTSYRGPIAFIGGGRVWGVADLHDVKPAHRGKAKDGIEPPQGFLWCFENLREVESIPCAVVAAPAMFMNGNEWEPLFLQASAQALLNRALSPLAGQEEAADCEMTQLPTEAVDAPNLAFSVKRTNRINQSAQMELFG